MSTYARIADRPVVIDGCSYERLQRPTSSGWDRVTTEIALAGAGHEGRGEDVWVDPERHDDYAAGRLPDLTGRWTIASLGERLRGDDVFPAPADPGGPLFRRWALEAAALDLALRQAGVSLATALGRTPRPIRFAQSVRLGDPSSVAPVRERRGLDPEARFKLDPVEDWDDALLAALVAEGPDVVQVLDFKALYHGTTVDQHAGPELYARCIAAFPDALIEDPSLAPAVRDVLGPHMDRVTWDAPIHGVADVTGLEHEPRVLNCKPCRFGGLRPLMDFYDHCEARGIALYGGGFFELGVGRGQIQYLASLFHPDGPNDVAPRGYHPAHPRPGLPTSPLDPPDAAAPGFRLADADA